MIRTSFFCVLALCSCRKSALQPAVEEPRLISIRCLEATSESAQRLVTLRGIVEVAPAHHAMVSAQIAGRVNSLSVHEGQRVVAGTVLAEVDGRAARDTALQARAATTGAQAALQNATVTAERTARLLEHGIASRQEVDDAQARLASARAVAASAQASLDAADRTAAFASVRAPIAGVVLRTLRAPGDLVDGTASTPLLELGDPAFLNLLASAVPSDLVMLSVGQTGEARFDAMPGETYKVKVSTIAPMIDPATGVGQVRLAFTGQGPPIGLFGQVRVAVGAFDVIRVPSTAIRGSPSGASEVLICEGRTLKAATVTLGAREANMVEVRSGLDAGVRFAAGDIMGVDDGTAYEEKR